jgi:hypothetical protein
MARKTSNWRKNAAALAVLAVLSFVGFGCGGTDERTSNLRPPAPINVSVAIGDDEISASPSKFGAGPIVLVVSNQSTSSHTLTIDGPEVKQSVGPISPQDTATLKVTVQPGDHTLSIDDAPGVTPERLTVGPKRPSAQNKLQQP